jgi:hypothetical protein
MTDGHSMCGQEVKSAAAEVEERIVREFLRKDGRRGIRAFEFFARCDPDEDQAIIGREKDSVRAAVVIGRPANEDLRLTLDLFSEMEHSALKFPGGNRPGFGCVDVTHEEEISEEKNSDYDQRETYQCSL